MVFQSGQMADNADHQMTVSAVSGEARGTVQVTYHALPGVVNISLLNVTEGQTVGGTLALGVDSKAPAALASASFMVNGKLIKEVTASPFKVDWDSTKVEPGPYQISVIVKDKVGNQGQVSVNVKVVPPIQLKIDVPQSSLEAGQQMKVSVEVTSLELITQVAFLVDGKNAAAVITKPYQFVFNSSSFAAGDHVLVVKATDSTGRTNEQSFPVKITPRPVTRPDFGWLKTGGKYALTGLGTLLALGLSVLGLILAIRFQKRRPGKTVPIQLTNLGNTPVVLQAQGRRRREGTIFPLLLQRQRACAGEGIHHGSGTGGRTGRPAGSQAT